ncbi:MAG: ATP-dependent sacrificial sulfur transferase LarE [Oscillospiraceae bacterium]|jgi:uncharacterized protein
MNQLLQYFKNLSGGVCIAFSGGVDSAVVLAAALKAGCKVHAVTLHSPLHSPADPDGARTLAQELGATHAVLTIEEIPAPIRDNPVNRCYLCKKELFSSLWDYTRRQGLAHLLDGTNADDHKVYRPGLRALKELGVKSPLAELGYSKEKVRALAGEFGLAVAQKPAAPCLATRFPYGTRLSEEAMAKADRIEGFLREQGHKVVRARIHGDTVRVEVPADDFAKLLQVREELINLCHQQGFVYVTMDLEGFRSGSMDVGLAQDQ